MTVVFSLDHQLITGDKRNPPTKHGQKFQTFVIKTA